MTTKNPWLGLASYEEPKNDGNDYLFCGRDEETLDVVRLIDNNLFITLYGSSGIGKTSLLRAGVIPILRRKDYFPLYVRLSQEPGEISYAEAVVRKLQKSGLTKESSIAMKHPEGNDRLYLWNYFATTRFLKDGREVYPVIILDQFEEVFREGDKAKAELLLKQIYLLLNDELEMPEESGYSADTNYRFVASIREDFLFVLEDSIDENSLDLYKNNRYRLRPMKPEQARQVVLVPGKSCIEESEKDKVADRIVALAKRDKRGDIDTLLLSLVCAGSFDKKAGEKITLSDLAVWKNNPMEVYYQEAIKGLSANQVRYIQQHLIRDDGSRRRVDVEEVKAAFGEATYQHLTQGANRLFAVGDKGQVELLHDQLGLAVYEERKAFEEREKKKKLRQRVTTISLILLAIAGIIFFQNYRLKQQRWKMMENQARFIAKTANDLVDDGDSYTAQRLLMEVLPKDLLHPNRPYISEAEFALRKAAIHNSAIIKYSSDDVFECVRKSKISPQGKLIASWRDELCDIRIMEVLTGKQINILEGHDEMVTSLDFSPDGRQIVSASDDKTIRIWDVETGKELKTLVKENTQEQVKSIMFSHDGKYVCSLGRSEEGSINSIMIWNAKTGIRVQSIEESFIKSVEFSPDDKTIIAASFYYNIDFWDVNTGKKVRTIEGPHIGCPIAFSPDGKQFLTHSFGTQFSPIPSEDTIYVWDTDSGKSVQKIAASNELHCQDIEYASFSPNGKYIVGFSGNTICVWDVRTGACRTLEDFDFVDCVSFSPDGNSIISVSSSGQFIRMWDLDSNVYNTLELKGHTSGINSIAYSSDGQYVVSASDDKTVRVWDAKTGMQIGNPLTGHTQIVTFAVFSPDGRQIASASADSTVRVWDLETGEVNVFKGHNGRVWSVAFSPDGEKIVSASDDDTLRIWQIDTGIYRVISGERDGFLSASFSPDGRTIVSVTGYGRIQFWAVDSCKEIMGKMNKEYYDFTFASFNKGGNQILSTNIDENRVCLWDVTAGKKIMMMEDPAKRIRFTSADISKDGEYIVSTGFDVSRLFNREHHPNDNTVIVWNAKNGEMVLNITHDQFNSVADWASFCPDRRHIALAFEDGIIRIIDFPPLQELIDQTRERFKDCPLTPEERWMYYLE